MIKVEDTGDQSTEIRRLVYRVYFVQQQSTFAMSEEQHLPDEQAQDILKELASLKKTAARIERKQDLTNIGIPALIALLGVQLLFATLGLKKQ